jgi:protein gp37
MTRSRIEWTDRSDWNPIRGCTRKSPGCGGPGPHGGCYAERIAARFSGPGQPFEGFAEVRNGEARWTGKVALIDERLEEPLRWRKPAHLFALSMSDLFHEALPVDDIAAVYGVAVAAVHLRRHAIQILTKRGDRMRETLHSPEFWDRVNGLAEGYVMERTDPLDRRSDDVRATLDDYGPDNPPPGIWLGVSVEDRACRSRIDELRATPAAVRFLSLEPLLEDLGDPDLTGIHLVIIGGESGPRARDHRLSWSRRILAQCRAASVSAFEKQLGAAPIEDGDFEGAAHPLKLRDRKGADMSEWPADLRVREMPEVRHG